MAPLEILTRTAQHMWRNIYPQGLGSSTASRWVYYGPKHSRGLNLYFQYDLPTSWGSGVDNVIAEGQVIELPSATYVHELHLLYAGDGIDS